MLCCTVCQLAIYRHTDLVDLSPFLPNVALFYDIPGIGRDARVHVVNTDLLDLDKYKSGWNLCKLASWPFSIQTGCLSKHRRPMGEPFL